MIGRTGIRILFVALFMISIPIMASGTVETEPNDSMDYPQVLINDQTLTGELNLNGSDDDVDIYRVDIKEGDLGFVKVKKVDTGSGQIQVNLYDDDRKPLTDDSWMGERTLSIAGQTYSKVFRTAEYTSYFIVILGRGVYNITYLNFDVDDPDDDDVMGETIDLEDGSEVDGVVFKISVDDLEYEDGDLYHVVVDTSDNLKVTVDRRGWSTEPITVYLYQGVVSEEDLVDKATMESGDESIVLKDTNDDYRQNSYYIYVEGEGNYTLSVDINYDPFSNTDMTLLLIMMLSMFCLPVAMMLIPVIIIVIVIILIVRSQKKNKPKKKKPYRRKVG